MVKNPHVMQENWVQSLTWEDPLEMEMATHSGILAWTVLWTEKPGSSSWGCKELDTTEQLTCIYIIVHLYVINIQNLSIKVMNYRYKII